MKKIIILLIAILPCLTSCQKNDTTVTDTQIREIAWESLKQYERAMIFESGKAVVAKTTYNGIQAYSVTFKSIDSNMAGATVVYVDVETLTVVGKNVEY
jgi:hypothetical protein